MAFITTTANSISSGGTISGDITIEGDLTVNGDGAGAYDEIVDGNLRISSTNKLEFGDTGTYIHQSADGVLDLVSDTEIEINATTIDMNGALDLSGNGTIGGTLTVNGDLADISGAHPTLKLTDSDDSNYATIGYSDGALSIQTNGGDESGAADTIIFYNHGSTERMRIKSNGNVQIGAHTSGTPLASNLFLVGTGATTEGIVVGRAGDSQNALDQYAQVNMYGGTTNFISRGGTSSEGTIALVTTSNGSTYNTRLFVNSNGNIGIGTSSVEANWLSTRTALQLGGTGAIFGATTAGADGDLSIGQNVYFHSGGSFKRIEADEASLYQQTAGTHTFSATASSTADSNITFTDVAKFDINSRISLSNNGGEATNTIFGYQAGNSIHASSGMNTFVGHQVADATMTADADENTAVGHLALSGLTSGEKNIAIGSYAGINITSGDENVLIGRSAGNNHNSSDLVAVGTAALASISDAAADGTVGVGHQALTALTTAAGNIAIGYQSMAVHTTGGKNVCIGYQTMLDTDVAGGVALTSSENVFIGYQVGSGTWENAASNHNVGIGNDVMRGALSGALYNVAVGSEALMSVTTGDANIVAGYQAGNDITTGEANICIGNRAGDEFDAENYNIFIGEDAGGGAINGADKCVAIGKSALDGAITQDGTIAIGHDALTSLTSGNLNTAIGFQALDALTTGNHNTAVGYLAGSAVGTDRVGTTAIGSKALHQNNPAGTTDYSVAVGTESGENQLTGYNNTFLGGNTNGNGTDAINQTVIGYSATGQADNTVTLGNANVTDVYMAMNVGARFTIGAGGAVTMPNQPAFLAHPASTQSAFAENSAVTVVFGTERFDQGSDFASNTFTAPVTGKYQLNASLTVADFEIAYDYYQIQIVTSNATYLSHIDPDGFDSNAAYLPLSISILADMDASDTAVVKVQAGGTGGGAGHDITAESYFSGYLVC